MRAQSHAVVTTTGQPQARIVHSAAIAWKEAREESEPRRERRRAMEGRQELEATSWVTSWVTSWGMSWVTSWVTSSDPIGMHRNGAARAAIFDGRPDETIGGGRQGAEKGGRHGAGNEETPRQRGMGELVCIWCASPGRRLWGMDDLPRRMRSKGRGQPTAKGVANGDLRRRSGGGWRGWQRVSRPVVGMEPRGTASCGANGHRRRRVGPMP
jgi:hypothetical protein